MTLFRLRQSHRKGTIPRSVTCRNIFSFHLLEILHSIALTYDSKFLVIDLNTQAGKGILFPSLGLPIDAYPGTGAGFTFTLTNPLARQCE